MLEQLVNCEDGFFVVCLVCELGKCENCYMYFFSGEVEDQLVVMDMLNVVDGDLQVCVEVLEIEVVELKQCFDLLLVYLGD